MPILFRKVALVTGFSRGIVAAAAKQLTAEAARVVVNYAKSAKKKRMLFLLATVMLLASLAAQPLLARNTTGGQATNETMSFDATSFAKTFTHHTASVNGIRLHYVMGGQGEPIVLLHGWLETWYAWRQVMPALAQRYTVIALDLPGLGDSDKPKSSYDARTVAAYIYGLAGKLGIKRIFLVGHDIGTWVAYAYAVAHQDEVRRLVLLDAAIPGVTPAQASQLLPTSNLKTWQFAFNQVPELPEALVAGRERLFLSWFFRNRAAHPESISEADINEFVQAYSAPGKMRAGFEYYRAAYDDITQNKEYATKTKQKLKMPVLALGGEKSAGPQMLHTVQLVAENVRGDVVKDCGHYIAQERPDYLAPAILSFFTEEKL